MKKFEYTWDDDCFILHIQIKNDTGNESNVLITRKFNDGTVKKENETVKGSASSYRFIISRSHPNELEFEAEYPESMVFEAFKIDDRAYYPTESFFVG